MYRTTVIPVLLTRRGGRAVQSIKPVWAEKKHKNGKVVKCKHGYPEREIVKWETISEHFGDMDEMQISYDKNGIYPNVIKE